MGDGSDDLICMSHYNNRSTRHLTRDAVYYGNHLSIHTKQTALSQCHEESKHLKETSNCALLDLLSNKKDETIHNLVRLKTYTALKHWDKLLLLRVNTTKIQSQNCLTQKLKKDVLNKTWEHMLKDQNKTWELWDKAMIKKVGPKSLVKYQIRFIISKQCQYVAAIVCRLVIRITSSLSHW